MIRQEDERHPVDADRDCPHIAIVSIGEGNCQCMDCLRVWPKPPGFKSDWPMFDRG